MEHKPQESDTSNQNMFEGYFQSKKQFMKTLESEDHHVDMTTRIQQWIKEDTLESKLPKDKNPLRFILDVDTIERCGLCIPNISYEQATSLVTENIRPCETTFPWLLRRSSLYSKEPSMRIFAFASVFRDERLGELVPFQSRIVYNSSVGWYDPGDSDPCDVSSGDVITSQKIYPCLYDLLAELDYKFCNAILASAPPHNAYRATFVRSCSK